MIADPLSQGAALVVLVGTWIGVTAILIFRVRAKAVPYLRRFPHVAGSTLERLWPDLPPWDVRRARRQAYWQRQSDPELEQLRREVNRRTLYMYLWFYGFPILVAGVGALLILTGYAH